MKKFFWITVFWFIVFFGFLGYLKWFNHDLGLRFTNFVSKQDTVAVLNQECPVVEQTITTGTNVAIDQSNIELNLNAIQKQLKDINEKLDIQNSNSPDAVSVSLRTTKKTNIWIFPLDGSEYKKYVMQASDDILKDALNLLFEKSPFALKDTKLDNDGNLTITLERVPNTAFGGSAAVEQARTSIEKTAMQFSQIKKVTIIPEEVLQP